MVLQDHLERVVAEGVDESLVGLGARLRRRQRTGGAAVEQAKAQLATDLLDLSYCTITAPFDGITSAALIQEGSYLSMMNNQLTTVFAISPIWVNFSLSEQQLESESAFAKPQRSEKKNHDGRTQPNARRP